MLSNSLNFLRFFQCLPRKKAPTIIRETMITQASSKIAVSRVIWPSGAGAGELAAVETDTALLGVLELEGKITFQLKF